MFRQKELVRIIKIGDAVGSINANSLLRFERKNDKFFALESPPITISFGTKGMVIGQHVTHWSSVILLEDGRLAIIENKFLERLQNVKD
jgi:hypothetical protein